MTQNWKYAVVLLLLAACGGDEENNAMPECPDGSTYNPILVQCVEDARETPNNDDDSNDSDAPDLGSDDEPDMGAPDMSDEPELGCQTDEDGDGSISMMCGGDDCDDNDSRRQPGGTELCDEVDNDCDEQVNEDVDCSVLAHSSSRLYRVDFFAGTYQDLGPTIDNLWDIDTHPDGTLYGIAGDKLYTYNETNGQWTAKAGTLSVGLIDPNGFCIDNEGKAFLTVGSSLREVDLVTGSSTEIGSMAPASSSGDCVVNKGNQLFMTSNHSGALDSFARINGDNGASTIVGLTSHDGIWGLTAAYSRVFGLTSEGDVVEIDVATGETTVLVSFPELSFYGAASTPLR